MDFVFPGLKTKFLPLLFLTSFRAEAEALFRIHPFRLIDQEKNIRLYQLPPEPIFLLITGSGSSFLDRWLEHIAPALLVNFGICGGLDPALPLFQNFLVRQVSHLDDPVISTEIHFPDRKFWNKGRARSNPPQIPKLTRRTGAVCSNHLSREEGPGPVIKRKIGSGGR